MPKLALQIRAQLENVTELQPASASDHMLMVRVKCTSCQEEHPKDVGIAPNEEAEVQKGRSTANLVMNCSLCKREMTAKFEEPTAKAPLWRPYSPSEGAVFSTLCVVEARGLDFVGFIPVGTWKCKSTESDTVFDSVEFEDGAWTDYDEKGGASVSIMELESQWVRA
ncbi:DUF866-domain-containing protein [Acaromyces ingoldii]|uniref:DUF866-domain-containing protein n=1 Tax=Acaromyces ingoldii TaxID=215250 RepID=A0A316YHN6_9BASI|nr:DUF866-domain-containing protein [Acaromyces ingoldii]PWN88947.1 DUF866-domain-containing protein [Acaromyces ingoldii]